MITKNPGKLITGLNTDGVLNLYIINAKTGRIIFNQFQKYVELNLPINMVYDENSVFVTYYNPIVYYIF